MIGACGDRPAPGGGGLRRARVRDDLRAADVRHRAGNAEGRVLRLEGEVDHRVDEALVAVDVQLLGVDEVAGARAAVRDVREAHLVVDPVGVEAERRVDPVAERARRRVGDRVPDRAPLDAVEPLVVLRRAVRLDQRRPGEPVLGVRPGALHGLQDPLVLRVVVLALPEQRERERAVDQLAVQVDAAVPLGPDLLQHLAEAARLGLRPRRVRPEREAERRPVAVHVDAVAVVALVEADAVVAVAALPAVRVGEDEVDGRAPQRLAGGDAHVGRRLEERVRDRALLRAGHRRRRQAGLAGRPGGEILGRAYAGLGAGPLDAVDREREGEELLVRLRHALVGHAQHVEVGALAAVRDAGLREPGRAEGGVRRRARAVGAVAEVPLQLVELDELREQGLQVVDTGDHVFVREEVDRRAGRVALRERRAAPAPAPARASTHAGRGRRGRTA